MSYSEKVNQGKKYGNIRPKPLNDLHLMVRDGQNKVYLPEVQSRELLKQHLFQNIIMKNTDVYSKIKVSDSEPIDERHLAIYQK